MKYVHSLTHTSKADEDRLRFAVQFAVMPLDRLRAGDWVNLKEDVAIFLKHARVGTSAEPLSLHHLLELRPTFSVVTDFPGTMPLFKAEMTRLQPQVSPILHDMAVLLNADGTIDRERTTQLTVSRLLPPPPRTSLNVAITHYPLYSSISGTVEAVFHWQLQHLITSAPIGKVALCRECSVIFHRVKLQVYCSRACANRVSQRRFRERQEADNKQLQDFAAAATGRPRPPRPPQVAEDRTGV